MSGGFFLFPWQRPFLPALKAFMDAPERRRLQTLLIVPHRRPWRYLQELYAAEPGGGRILPKMLTMTEVFSAWRAGLPPMPLRGANILDCVALLHDCVRALSSDDEGLERLFSAMPMERFFPWGVRLAGLLEEMFGQCVDVRDLPYAEDEVAPHAAALLGALGRIGSAYLAALEERRWTTPGLDALLAARHAATLPPLLRPSGDRAVVIAGFFQLTASEDAVLRSLWEQGADVCLHTDPALAAAPSGEGKQACHWACLEHARWLRDWRATPCLMDVPGEDAEPERHFFAGYDAHSQIGKVCQRLADGNAPQASTAVILGDGGLLMPLLHELPDKNVNISMGYPLERTPLYQLLDSLLRLQERENATEDGLYYWRALQAVLAHPYPALLRPSGAGEGTPLRPALFALDRQLRRGQRFVSPQTLLASVAEGDEETQAMLCLIVERLISAFASLGTTAEMAAAIEGVCSLLLEYGEDIWAHYPLDAEALYRVMQKVLPVLRDNALAHRPLTAGQLRGITREVLRQERIPFEADPLSGVQILGMLETRLLHFERVHILEATDDRMPGQAAQDVLLPDSLRPLIGLPDTSRRELVMAHNLYRLCASARQVFFYWQEGSTRSALFDGKKCRSRFVEQAVWHEEVRRGRLLAPGDGLLETAACTVRPFEREQPLLPRTPALNRAMETFLDAAPLSPTHLDAYLRCPLRFVRTHLCGLRALDGVNEGDDPAAIGSLLHEVLQQVFRTYENRVLPSDTEEKETLLQRLNACFQEKVAEKRLRRTLPPDSMAMLLAAVPLRFRAFVDALPSDSLLLGVEQKIEASLVLRSGEQRFYGIMDRLDRRDGLVHILDYKTGSIALQETAFWEDTALLARMAALEDGDDATEADETLAEVRSLIPSVQLLCYLAMARALHMGPLGNAACVELRSDGRECAILNAEAAAAADMDVIIDRCEDVISFLVWHMRYAPSFTGCVGGHCAFCPLHSLCPSPA